MSKKKTAALGAGVLSAALVGSAAFGPAAAAQTEDSAFALSADGLVSIPKTPSVAGEGSESLVAADLPPEQQALVGAGVLNAEASDGYAKSSVTDATVNLGEGLNLGVELVSAECDNLNGNTSIATVTLNGNEIALDGLEPNTEVIPEPLQGIAKLTLNKQVEEGDALNVTALSVDLLNSTQTIDIASATCTEGAQEEQPPPDDGGGDGGDNGGGDNGGDNGGGDNGGDNGGDDGGDAGDGADQAGPDGAAPQPTPQPGHLDVTG